MALPGFGHEAAKRPLSLFFTLRCQDSDEQDAVYLNRDSLPVLCFDISVKLHTKSSLKRGKQPGDHGKEYGRNDRASDLQGDLPVAYLVICRIIRKKHGANGDKHHRGHAVETYLLKICDLWRDCLLQVRFFDCHPDRLCFWRFFLWFDHVFGWFYLFREEKIAARTS